MKYLRLHDIGIDEDYQLAVEDDDARLQRVPKWVPMADQPHHYNNGQLIPTRDWPQAGSK